MEVNRTISPTTANKGQKVSVTYDVVNTGTLDISDVTITEDKSISSKKGTIASIKAGEKGSYTFTATMGSKDLTSKATITYNAEGKKNTVTKEAATVKYGEVKLSASLDADKKGGMSGDAVYDEVEPIVDAITPVPGGVGAVTSSVLIGHVVEAAERTIQ